LIRDRADGETSELLDFACGIGTQAIGLAALGYRVTGTDLSPAAVARARTEAAQRGLRLRFEQADMRAVDRVVDGPFDVVLAADNALPHLACEDEIRHAVSSLSTILRPGGLFLTSLRDYDAALISHPSSTPPVFIEQDGHRRIVHQVWEWLDERCYRVHLHIALESGSSWHCRHHVGWYRALRRAELDRILRAAGLSDPGWHMPEKTGYHQPLVIARKR
jgi:SAM-dependent methyltransferase